MKIKLNDNFLDNDYQLMRKCGYFLHQDKNTGKASYLRNLSTSAHYPRFHLFLERENQQLLIDLHLDQKKPSYQGQKAHSGEAESEVVRQELHRIINSLNNIN